MTLTSYIASRYLRYFIVINCIMTLLFNLIDFLEKVTRMAHGSFSVIAQFSALTFVPSFFDSFPLSAWLATVLMIKELDQHKEWEALQLLTIDYPAIIKPLIACSLGLMLTAALGKELLTLSLAQQAEQFKRVHLKHQQEAIIANCWLTLSPHQYCHVSEYRKDDRRGNNILLVTTNEHFSVTSLIFAPTFTTLPESNTLVFDSAIICNPETGSTQHYPTFTLQMPSFFTHFSLSNTVLSIPNLIMQLCFMYPYLSATSLRMLSLHLVQRMTLYLDIMLYPLITFTLFYSAPLLLLKPLILMLLPYPLMLASHTIIGWLIDQGLPISLLLLPYLLMLLFLARILSRKAVS